MNRTIKFRVWNKKSKCFGALSLHTGFSASGFFTFGDDEQACIQEFTGLKDKNYHEIFEGDILKINITDEVVEPNNNRKIIAKVIWDDYSARWIVEGESGEQYPFGSDENCYIGYKTDKTVDAKVIGNIFENPELINHE